jgi:hypothetical protein
MGGGLVVTGLAVTELAVWQVAGRRPFRVLLFYSPCVILTLMVRALLGESA